MKKLFIAIFLIFICSGISFSQIKLNVKASLTNTFRYGNGTQIINAKDSAKEYFENLSDARLTVNDIIFGMRYEISDPIEWGRDFKGIRKRYVEYKGSDVVSLRAGDFYDVIGRGLTLNVFEQRLLGYDTGIDGVRIFYNNTFGKTHPIKLKAGILGGNIEYSDFLNPNRIETYKIRDVNLEISPFKFLTIGGNYVYAKGSIPSGNIITNITADIPEVFASFNLKGLQIFTSYAHKHTITDPNQQYPISLSTNGDAFYSSISYSMSGFGVTLEYKNYRFDLTAPNNRSSERPTKMLPFQNPPTAVKEHTSTLVSRNPKVVDFNDEVGAQLELNIVPNDKLSFLINTAVASRHYKYEYIFSSGIYKRIERSFDLIPAFEDEYDPFWEVYVESEYYATDKIYTKLALSKQNFVTFTYPKSVEKIFATTIPFEFKYSLKEDLILKLLFEQQWVHNSIRIHDKNFTNQLIAIGFIKSPELTFTISAEYTSDKEDPSGKRNWFKGELTYNITSSNLVTISYGRERGGLTCASGICRYVFPFDGFRILIQTKF